MPSGQNSQINVGYDNDYNDDKSEIEIPCSDTSKENLTLPRGSELQLVGEEVRDFGGLQGFQGGQIVSANASNGYKAL